MIAFTGEIVYSAPPLAEAFSNGTQVFKFQNITVQSTNFVICVLMSIIFDMKDV